MKKNIFAPVGHFKHFGEGGGKPFSFIFFFICFSNLFRTSYSFYEQKGTQSITKNFSKKEHRFFPYKSSAMTSCVSFSVHPPASPTYQILPFISELDRK